MESFHETNAFKDGLDRRICIAPMMDCTDRHFRYLMRLISRDVFLYTEMVVSAALIHGDANRFLRFSAAEQPVALQIGGSDPDELATAARMGEDAGYCEINMNVGCPSDRVQAGRFGACLMLEPDLVADCVRAMKESVSVPVTVKCRIGVDDRDSYELLRAFIEQVAGAGCSVFVIHARKAWLNGLSPRQNREIPPLSYSTVYRLHDDFPDLQFIINGGITDLEQTRTQLKHVPGVMIGRAAYANPWLLKDADALLGRPTPVQSRSAIVKQYCEYIDAELSDGVFLKHMSRHLLGLYLGQPGARLWRRTLSEGATSRSAGLEVIDAALDHVESAQDYSVAS